MVHKNKNIIRAKKMVKNESRIKCFMQPNDWVAKETMRKYKMLKKPENNNERVVSSVTSIERETSFIPRALSLTHTTDRR